MMNAKSFELVFFCRNVFDADTQVEKIVQAMTEKPPLRSVELWLAYSQH
jgi:hypothetical protein